MKIVLILLAVFSLASCAVRTFDYIIVGGAASGTIASVQLSKKFPSSSVLLLERGMSDLDAPETHRMDAWTELLLNEEITESIRYKNGVWTLAGHVLSGGSGLNAGLMGQETDAWFTEVFGLNSVQ